MSELDAIIKDINKKYGIGTIRPGNEFPRYTRIPTGILSLDLEIGGGLPKGRIVIFTGNESAGKTTVAKLAIAQFQKTCKHCLGHIEQCGCVDTTPEPHTAVFVDIEGAFDANWFTQLGGNLEDLLVIQPEFAEQACDVVEALVGSGEVDIIVVDSIAMMSPAVEIEESSEKALVGTHARLMNKMMRLIQSRMNSLGMTNERKPTVILINQIRQKVGVMYGSPDTYPGGLGQKFASSITVKFSTWPSDLVYENDGDKKKDIPPVAVPIRFKVEKNKTFVPYRSGTFTLYVSDSSYGVKGTVNTLDQIIDYGTRYGFIEKSGAWLTVAVDHPDFKSQFQGKKALADALLKNGDVAEELVNKVLHKIIEESAVTIVSGEDD